MLIPFHTTIFPVQINQTYLRASIQESITKEDDGFNLLESLKESAPVCERESELLEYCSTVKITRQIDYIFVHCTATQPTATVTAIENYWRNRRGWRNPGYHVILPPTGFTLLHDFNLVANGVAGYNSRSLHISYIGGVDTNGKAKDTRTASQSRYINLFCSAMSERLKCQIMGHNEVSNKACPSFDVKAEYPHFY